CEYMTGGRAVILGATGRNFGAGMSGGIAYVYDTRGDFRGRVNRGMVEVTRLAYQEDIGELRDLVSKHANLTGSEIANALLDDWENAIGSFYKVISPAYRRVLELQAENAAREVSV
ncbi:MAG: hypothetical protein E4H09_00645, partial [Spirochaetales bacterium]